MCTSALSVGSAVCQHKHMATTMDFETALQQSLDFYNSGVGTTVIHQLKPEQRACLNHLYNGTDVIGNLPTGFGKSLIFHLVPGLLSRKLSRPTATILVIAPLNVIQQDQQKTLIKRGLRTCILDYKCNNSERVLKEDFDVIFAHPEAFFKSEKGQELIRDEVFQQRVTALCVDEAHKAEEWSKIFRKAFAELYTLRTFFQNVPLVALSGTITTKQLTILPGLLGLKDQHIVVSANPDRPNIFLERRLKDISGSPTDTYERLYGPLVDDLYASPDEFPVTLLYIPMNRQAECAHYCMRRFGFDRRMEEVPYAPVYSRQAAAVINHVIEDLKKEKPHVRLVPCTAAVGMGFDPPCVDRVIHTCPPRCISDYFQQIGRAGRSGQAATATLFFTNADIKSNLPDIQEDIQHYCRTDSCMRTSILSAFGYAKNAMSPDGCLCCTVCKEACTCISCVPL